MNADFNNTIIDVWTTEGVSDSFYNNNFLNNGAQRIVEVETFDPPVNLIEDPIFSVLQSEDFIQVHDWEKYLDEDIENRALAGEVFPQNLSQIFGSDNRVSKSKSDKHECIQCNLSFPSLNNLKQHFTTMKHRRAEGSLFYQSFSLNEKVERSNIQSEKIDESTWCELCKKSFAKPCYLKQHNLTHHSGFYLNMILRCELN
jgi:Zinc-finger of C2H2 type